MNGQLDHQHPLLQEARLLGHNDALAQIEREYKSAYRDYYKIYKAREESRQMDAREQLFANLFNEHKPVVASMDDDSLRAHIEELSNIAFQAKAFLHAASEEGRERNARKKKGNGGINTSVAIDETTSNAIHTITQRQEKLSKSEKGIANLVALGFDRADAERMYAASTINAVKKRKPGEKAVTFDDVTKKFPVTETKFSKSIRGKCPICLTAFPEGTNNGMAVCEKCGSDVLFEKVTKVTNPFAKKEEPEPVKEYPPPTEEDLKRGEDLNNIRLAEVVLEVAKLEEKQKEEPEAKPKFVNPFAKK